MTPLEQTRQFTGSIIPVRTPHWDTFPLDTLMARRMGGARQANLSAEPDTPDKRSAPEASPSPDRAAIDRWHIARLHAMLLHARANSPFYASHFADVAPDDIRTRDDLALLPRITADDIRHSGSDMLCVSQDEIARIVTLDTSGTSGPPKRLYFSQDDLDRTKEFFTMGMQAVACAGDTVLALLPDERPSSVGRLLAQSVINMGARPLSGSITRGGEALSVMAIEERVRVIVGSPMHMRTFAMGWQAMGFPKGVIHTVLLCWDAIPQTVIDLLHEVLGCRVLTHWGMTETGLGGALACAEKNGMHLREDELLAEITDPATGTLLPDGEWGELTITTLCRKAMPLIRYRTGDYGRFLPEACTCGSPLRRMDHSPGRLQDDITLPDGGTLRLIDLDNVLLPLHTVLDYTAHWHEAFPRKDGQGHTAPCLDIVLQISPIQPRTAAGQSLSPELLAETVIKRLSGTPALRNSFARQQLMLHVTAVGEDSSRMDYAKRRIRRCSGPTATDVPGVTGSTGLPHSAPSSGLVCPADPGNSGDSDGPSARSAATGPTTTRNSK